MPKTVGLVPERKKINELGKVYAYIKKEVIKEMQKISLVEYSEIRAMKTRNRISRLLELTNRKTYQWTKGAIPAAYNEAIGYSRISLDVLGMKPNPLFSPKIHASSVDKFINETVKYLINANGSIKNITNAYLYLMKKASEELLELKEFDGWEAGAEDWIREEILEGVETGASRQVVARGVREYLLNQMDEDGLINVKGRRYQPRKYSEMVARTEMRSAQSEAVINSCHEYESDLVAVSDHGTTTPICLPYEGGIFSLSGRSAEYPYLEAYPPFHPNCQHYITPTSPEAVAFEART